MPAATTPYEPTEKSEEIKEMLSKIITHPVFPCDDVKHPVTSCSSLQLRLHGAAVSPD